MENNHQSAEIQLKSRASGLVSTSGDIQVVDQESATAASVAIRAMKETVAKWKVYWKPEKDRAKATHAGLCAKEKELLDRLEPAIAVLSRRLATWTEAEREKARRAQEELDKAEWERRQKEREVAQKVEDVVNFEDAAAIIEKAGPDKPLPPAPRAPDLGGLQMRDHWVFEIVDAELIPRRFLMPDEPMIQRHVTEHKGETNIPGVRAINRPIIAKTARRTS